MGNQPLLTKRRRTRDSLRQRVLRISSSPRENNTAKCISVVGLYAVYPKPDFTIRNASRVVLLAMTAASPGHFQGANGTGIYLHDEVARRLFNPDYLPAQTLRSSTVTSQASVISSRQANSRGEWGLCWPEERLGVGRPSSVSCEPSVPPRMLPSL